MAKCDLYTPLEKTVGRWCHDLAGWMVIIIIGMRMHKIILFLWGEQTDKK